MTLGSLSSRLQIKWFRQQPWKPGRYIVVVSVLLVSAVSVSWVTPSSAVVLLGLLVGTAGFVVLLRNPALGLVILVVSTFFVPYSLGTGTHTSINITALLLPFLIVIWLADMVVVRRRFRLAPSGPIYALLIFMVVVVLSFGFGQLRWFYFASSAPLRAQIGGLSIFALSAGAFLLTAHQIRDLRWLKILTWVFILVGAALVAGRIVPIVGQVTGSLIQSRATGSLFWTWLAVLAASQAAFNDQLRKAWRLLLGGLVVAVFYVGLGQTAGWTSGWLPPFVGVVVTLWIGVPRLLVPSLLASIVVLVPNFQRLTNLLLAGGNRYSLITRVEAWRIMAEILKVSPLLGLGPANYYWYTPLYPILGWRVNFNSHNNFVDIVVQSGLLGLAAFLWFFFELGKLGFRLLPQANSGFERAYVIGALGGLFGTLAAAMLADWVLPFVYNIGVSGLRASIFGWLFLGGLLAIDRMIRERSTAESWEHS